MLRRDLGIKHIKQLENYCGPASLAMVANYHGISLSQERIAPFIEDPFIIKKYGVSPSQIVIAAQNLELRALWKSKIYLEEILDYLDSGIPTIAIVSGTKKAFHYSVIGGYEQYPTSLLLHDSALSTTMELYSQFSRRWRTNVDKKNWVRHGIVVSK